MTQILVILQCAYGTTAWRRAQLRNRALWLRGLWASHTGRRLAGMLPEGCEVAVINASTEIGDNPRAVYPPDLAHIQAALDEYQPRIVLACGRIAQRGLQTLGVSYFPAPHPAWRALTKDQAAGIRQRLAHILAQQL